MYNIAKVANALLRSADAVVLDPMWSKCITAVEEKYELARGTTIFKGKRKHICIEGGWREKQRQRSLRLFGKAELIQFLAALAILPRSIRKKEESTFSSKSTEAKQPVRQGIE